MPNDDPFAGFRDEFLEQEPEIAYYSHAPRFGQAPSQRRFYEDSFSRIYNQYLGRLGQQVMGGQTPDLHFKDYLGNFNFNDYFQSQPPSFRGEGSTQGLAPRSRWLF